MGDLGGGGRLWSWIWVAFDRSIVGAEIPVDSTHSSLVSIHMVYGVLLAGVVFSVGILIQEVRVYLCDGEIFPY